MNYISFFFIYFIIIKNVFDKSSSLEISFKKETFNINNDFILSNYDSDIYISLKIGSKRDNLEKIFLKSDTNEFMISNSSSQINNNYNPEESSYSKMIVYLKTYYQLKYTYKAKIFSDKFFLSNRENIELPELGGVSFLYANKLNIDKYPGIIGLKLEENQIKNAKVFPCQLTDLKYSINSTWMIKYENDNEGYFYVGDILNDNIFSGFNSEKYRKTNAVFYGNYLSWDLTFSQIKSNNVILNGPMQAFLDFNFGLISCSNEYYDHIKSTFFNEYIKNGMCTELFYYKENNQIKLNSNFAYIVCDKSLKIKDFPELIFSHSTLDNIFTLTYEDLFVVSNDKTYFLIINEIGKIERWKIGKIFFKKYNIIFDYNAKTIGIYDDFSNKSKIALIVLEWIIVILLILVVLFLAFILIKRYRINNYKFFGTKIKVDEMEENYNEFFENKNETKNINIDNENNGKNKIIENI